MISGYDETFPLGNLVMMVKTMVDCVCIKCKKLFEFEDRIRCPHCGFRIIAKKRPVFRKRVIAR